MIDRMSGNNILIPFWLQFLHHGLLILGFRQLLDFAKIEAISVVPSAILRGSDYATVAQEHAARRPRRPNIGDDGIPAMRNPFGR